MCACMFLTEKPPFAELVIISYVTHDRLTHSLTTLRSVSDSTRFSVAGVKRHFWPLRNFWPFIVYQLLCFWE